MYRYNSFIQNQLLFDVKVLLKDFSQVAKLSTNPLNIDQINYLMETQNLKAWHLNDHPQFIKNEFKFPSFKEGFAFMGSISSISDQMEHYPLWFNSGSLVKVTLGSQDSGIIIKDIILAFVIEQVKQDIETNSITYLTEQSKLVKSPQIVQLWNQNYSLQNEDSFEQIKRNINQC